MMSMSDFKQYNAGRTRTMTKGGIVLSVEGMVWKGNHAGLLRQHKQSQPKMYE